MKKVYFGIVGAVMTEDAAVRSYTKNGKENKVVDLNLQVGKGFLQASIFGAAADHAASLKKGQTLLVSGDLGLDRYDDKNGNKASKFTFRVNPYYGIQFTGTKDNPQVIDINKFFVGGRLTKEPEEMKTGVRGSIAVDTDRTDEKGNPVTVFMDYMAFDDEPVKTLKALTKGAEVVLECSAQNGVYTNKKEQKVNAARLIVTAVHSYASEAPAKKGEPKAKAEPKEEKPEVKADVVTDVPDQGVDSLGLDFDDLEL